MTREAQKIVFLLLQRLAFRNIERHANDALSSAVCCIFDLSKRIYPTFRSVLRYYLILSIVRLTFRMASCTFANTVSRYSGTMA